MEARRTTYAVLLALASAALLGAFTPASAWMASGDEFGAGIPPIAPMLEIDISAGGPGAMNVDVDDDGQPFTEKSFAKSGDLLLAPGDTLKNDLYQWGQMLEVDGTLDGDVIAWVQSAKVMGVVTQDVNVFSQDLSISGEVGDDVRAMCQSLSLDGRVKGDILAFAATFAVSDRSVVEGDVRVGCGAATINGTINGNLALYAGQVNLNGRVLGDAMIASDAVITLGENARIDGNLSYKAPVPIEVKPGQVGGEVTFIPQEEGEEKGLDFEFPKGLGVVFHIFLFVAAVIAGSILVALTKDHANRTASILRRKPLKSLGIGFIAFICVPVLVLITLVLILTIPLSMILLLGYAIVAYIAKFYVAIWLGSLITRRKDGDARSPVPVMILGLVVLYILTALPFVGTLFTFLIVFLGFGALLQRKETRLDKVFETERTEPNGALPGTFPGSQAGA